jgi:polyisoprenyl-phosphate glycosyltransferase
MDSRGRSAGRGEPAVVPRYRMMNRERAESISVVVPVYGCPQALPELCGRLTIALSEIADRFEILLVNDACPKDSWTTIRELASRDARIRGIDLSRNFGQHNAITAGLDRADSAWVVVMDCDLQDRPEEIAPLFRKAQEGFDIVLGRRKARRDSFVKRAGSRAFYALLSYLTDTKIDGAVCNFGIYRRSVIDALKTMRERLRFFPLMVRWIGFKTATIDIDHDKRSSGGSSYTLKKLLNLGLNTVLAFSDKPLKITVQLGACMSAVAFLFALAVFFKALFTAIPVTGWASLMVSLWFLAGLVISLLGMIGIYLGKTFDETKRRPLYIIRETINGDQDS